MHASEVMWHKENGGTTWNFKSRLNNQEGYAQDVIYHSEFNCYSHLGPYFSASSESGLRKCTEFLVT